MEWLAEPFALGFQQRALIGGLMAAFLASTVGSWLVLRGMSFFGDAFVHGVIPGIAAAVVLDVNPILGAAVAAAIMIAAIEIVQRATSLSADTSIGLLFVGMLALGVVIVSQMDSYSGNLTSILFGDALGISSVDIVSQAILLIVVILVSAILYRPLLALSLSPEKAALLGMKPRITHFVLLVLIAAAVIGSFQSLGTLLVFGLLVGPPATASLFSKTVLSMMLISALFGSFSVWLGLVISFYWETAASATMAIIPIILFFLALTVRYLARWVRSRIRS